jgi:hypothetical protein
MKYDYPVHPVADMFPMIANQSKDWNALKFSFNDHGQLDPIVIHEGVLLDGRNRLAMCKMLGLEPKVIEFREVMGGDIGDEEHPLVISEWILAKNLARRNLTPDQQAAVVIEVNRWAVANESRQEAERSRFKEGTSGNPSGKKKEQVTEDSPSPALPSRDRKKSDANSTVVKLAAQIGVSVHKIRQAVAVAKAEADGTVPEGTLDAVKAGTIKASAAVKMIAKNTKPQLTFEEAFAKRWKVFTKGIAASDAPKFRQLISNQLKNPTI